MVDPPAHARGLGDPRIERRHLEYFIAVSECGGFKAAGERLFVAASGIAQGIRQLEHYLGVTLFERSRLGSRLTPEGRAVVGPAHRALRAFDLVVAAASEVAGLSTGTLDTISTPSLAQEPLSTLIGVFRRRHPGVRVRLTAPAAQFVSEITASIVEGENEIGVTEHPGGAVDGIRITPMYTGEIWAVCPPGTTGMAERIPRSRLVELGIIVAPYWESSDLYRQLRATCPEIDDAIVIRTEHRDSFISLAMAGAGAVLTDTVQARRAAMRGAIVARLDPPLTRDVVVVCRDSHLSPAAAAFLELCRDSGSLE
ncbi:LysR family transcriptional regulator [Pseudonocardia nigra]|uniref:LysR family transcriptional regulator n=1 Tax=Pseudonocardia nigra TaxID=1921578 RepID=UPI001C5E28EA|nr:LysR family transcriptional regulator [Pseudonocardia nigra]